MDKRMYTNQLAPDERAKHAYYCQKYQDEVKNISIYCDSLKILDVIPSQLNYSLLVLKTVVSFLYIQISLLCCPTYSKIFVIIIYSAFHAQKTS